MIDDGCVDLTYAEVGATRSGGALPSGYRHVHRTAVVGAFAAAREALRSWDVFRGAGLVVRASAAEAAVGVEITNGLGLGPVRLWVPCRIVWLLDEPGHYGYGMGTRPGHPESGEEAFVVALDGDGRTTFEVRSFSRPALWYARLGGPVTRALQDWMTGRYVKAVRRLA